MTLLERYYQAFFSYKLLQLWQLYSNECTNSSVEILLVNQKLCKDIQFKGYGIKNLKKNFKSIYFLHAKFLDTLLRGKKSKFNNFWHHNTNMIECYWMTGYIFWREQCMQIYYFLIWLARFCPFFYIFAIKNGHFTT
jgi:hypothetical protein